ncbi:ATP-binding protein [Enterococcus rivorum]|uniref:ATP-binding protein n=1 Tax=Enterococcus rivorum TaxID=762845 RepID=A0A1E5KXX5_9ENTE|nr:ATP-binding protein [Enterococcus rivorum]MBP2099768.1 DNA-directed RNA polymerase subunit RPC12/RpoP [Enterococcus rivorum]OEH82648.1 ATP-binding protein [Enterococcus rivorum]
MDTFTHKCPNCDGPLLFDPKDQQFHCEYCLNIYAEAEISNYEQIQRDAHLEDTSSSNENLTLTTDNIKKEDHQESTQKNTMDLFLCSSCGAEIVTDSTTAATYCYYCHNPVVLSGRLSGKFLPDKVLPFTVEKEQAVEKFLSWTKRKRFIPKGFFAKEQIEKITGVYFPYWVVDVEFEGQINAVGTNFRIWRAGDIEYTETKQFDITREAKMTFKEIIKNALSKNTQQKMIEDVQPYLLDKAIPFKSQYLAGFQAEKRDIEYKSFKESIETELKNYSELLLSETISGYTRLTKIQKNVSLANEQINYMLLPIWLVTYRNKDKSGTTYYYAMNGQTGKVSGELPIDYHKLGIFTFAIFVILAAIFLFGGWLI